MDNTALYCAIANQHTTQPFGNVTARGTHRGRDSRAAEGTTVYAAGSGTVTRVTTRDPVYGYRVEVTYHVGRTKVIVGDGHLSRIEVHLDQEVNVSTVIGLSGGRRGAPGAGVSTAAHLHEDCVVDGHLTNPDDVLNPRTTAPTAQSTTPLDPQTTGEIMSLLPAVFKIQNTDARGNPTSAGLSGVFFTLDHDHGYVYPADQLTAVLNVSAPYFNNGIATVGSKIGAVQNGVPLLIAQENAHILLRDRGFPDNILEQTSLAGGGHFYRTRAVAGADDSAVLTAIAALAKTLTPTTVLQRFRDFWVTGK